MVATRSTRKSADNSADTALGSTKSSVWVRIDAFLSLKAEKTRETYIGVLREWCNFLGAGYGSVAAANLLASAQELHALAFRAWLERRPGHRPRGERRESRSRELTLRTAPQRERKTGYETALSNATIAKKFAVLHRIYRMLIGAGLVTGLNPFDPDRAPPPPKNSGRKRPTEMIEFSLVKKIIALPESNEPKCLRDKAVLAVLFGGGLRRSEVVKLKIGDLRKTRSGTIFLYLRATKSNRDAQQALPSWAAKILLTLLDSRLLQGAKPSDFLFVSFTGKGGLIPTRHPLSTSGVYQLFKHYCRLAGAGPFVSPHSARATAITRLLAAGIPHREVQEFSRHSSVQMVELYDKRRIGVDENAAKDLKY